jgi:hypothetical protein
MDSDLTEPDENILTLDVSDDALERAAGAEGRAMTVVYCTQVLAAVANRCADL